MTTMRFPTFTLFSVCFHVILIFLFYVGCPGDVAHVYCQSSRINHSCRPNAVVSSDADVRHILAAATIGLKDCGMDRAPRPGIYENNMKEQHLEYETMCMTVSAQIWLLRLKNREHNKMM